MPQFPLTLEETRLEDIYIELCRKRCCWKQLRAGYPGGFQTSTEGTFLHRVQGALEKAQSTHRMHNAMNFHDIMGTYYLHSEHGPPVASTILFIRHGWADDGEDVAYDSGGNLQKESESGELPSGYGKEV